MAENKTPIARGVQLRDMTAADGAAMAQVHRRAILAVPEAALPADQRDAWAHGIGPGAYSAAAEGRETFLLALMRDELAGFVSYAREGVRGEIAALYVDPDWQGHGIGRRLCERAEAILRGHGAQRVLVRSSPAARAAYAALGFEETGRAVHRTRGGRELPVVVMEKSLSWDWRNFYGRRHGKALRDSQKAALARLADLSPGPVTRADNPERHPLDLARFGGRPLWLEIGFGGGEHLVHQAATNPDVQLIGAEPFVNGVAMLLSKIEAARLANVAVHPGDVRDLLEVLPVGSVTRSFLLYPDPWPKRRHHRRRFVTPGYLAPLSRVMAQGAALRLATDIPDYVRQARVELPRHGFREETVDERSPWPDWTRTRYEAKALREGRRPHYLTYRRV